MSLSEKAIKKLYYQENLSAADVGKKLGVSSWAVLSFMKRKNLRRRSFSEANSVVFNSKSLSFSAKKKLSFFEKELKIAGIMLYWAEGSKSLNGFSSVDFCNSDSRMIRLFLEFLRKICGVDEERLRVHLYCYADQDIAEIKKYWANLTKIPLSQFVKPYIRKDFSIEKKREMKYGLAHIRYSDKKLLLQINKWIEEMVNNRVGTEVDKPDSL